MPERTCSVPDCPKPLLAKGLCSTHYTREYRKDPAKRALRNATRQKWRHSTEAGKRERERNTARRQQRRETDPVYREQHAAEVRERYASDPAYREYRKRYSSAYQKGKQSDPEYRAKKAAANRRRLKANPAARLKALESSARYSKRRKSFLGMVRTTAGCVDCGTSDGKLDFDHRDPATKNFTIGGKPYALKKLIEEIELCDVRCASCHAKRHIRDDPDKVFRASAASQAARQKKRSASTGGAA